MRRIIGLAILEDEVIITSGRQPPLHRERSFYSHQGTSYWSYFRAVLKRPRLLGLFLLSPRIVVVSDIRYHDSPYSHLSLETSSSLTAIDPGIIITAGCGVDIRQEQRTLFLVVCRNRIEFFVHFCGGLFHPVTLELEQRGKPLANRLMNLLQELHFSELPTSILSSDFNWSQQEVFGLKRSWKKPISQEVHVVNAQTENHLQDLSFGSSENFNFVIHQNYHNVYEQGLQVLCTDISFTQLMNIARSI